MKQFQKLETKFSNFEAQEEKKSKEIQYV